MMTTKAIFKRIIRALDNSKLTTFQMYVIAISICIIGSFISDYKIDQKYIRIIASAELSEAVVTKLTHCRGKENCHFTYNVNGIDYEYSKHSDYRSVVGDTMMVVYNNQDVKESTAVKLKDGHPILSTKSYKIIKLNNLPQPKRDSLKRSVLAELRKIYLEK